jgi:NADPH:quinone reductase-like Zn-dependent oxidoreductase
MTHTTEAWVLYRGQGKRPGPGQLVLEELTFAPITADECLVRPIYGCWERNMGDALDRNPVDICRERGEERVVIGNAGAVEVLEVGANVTAIKPGDRCIVFCNGTWDDFGYPKTMYGYDTPGSIGVLAKLTKLHHRQLIPIPDPRPDLLRWAAFSLRYITAFSNWRLAHGVLRLQVGVNELPDPFVWGWGGGVSLAELHLARLNGCRAAQVSSRPDRRAAAERLGVQAIDRNEFPELRYDEERYQTDDAYRERYARSEARFLELVAELTGGKGVNIFIDFVGSPVIRATVKAMARQGVLTTAGWKEGEFLWFLRASECVARHQHVHSHYARFSEGIQAVRFASANNWLPIVDPRIYQWEEVPELAANYRAGRFIYYPCFRINPE